MALVLANRVQETATANTTVSFTLTGAVSGFQTFTVIGNTNTTYYSATDTAGNWEVGLGTYSTTGPTLTRTTIYASSNSNNAVTFPGTVNVFVTYPSGRSVNLDASGNVSALGTVSSGTWQGSTVGVAYGGTGVTTSSGANSVMLRDANQNVAVNRLNQSNTSTTAAGGTTALTAASSYIHTLVGTGGQTYTMPDATTLTTGVAFVFNNMATGTLTIQNYTTGAVGTIPAGGAGAVFLTDNSTTGGIWDIHAYLPEGVTFGTNAFDLGTSIVSGGTWQGGTIQPGYGGTGLTTFTGANNALYSTGATTLTAGTLPIAAGGTGQVTQQAALNALSGTQTANRVLRSDGTNVSLSQVALSTDVSGTLSTTNGGTGLTTFGAANKAIYSTSSSALTADTLPVAAGGTGSTSLAANKLLIGGTTVSATGVDYVPADQSITVNGFNISDIGTPSYSLVIGTNVYKAGVNNINSVAIGHSAAGLDTVVNPSPKGISESVVAVGAFTGNAGYSAAIGASALSNASPTFSGYPAYDTGAYSVAVGVDALSQSGGAPNTTGTTVLNAGTGYVDGTYSYAVTADNSGVSPFAQTIEVTLNVTIFSGSIVAAFVVSPPVSYSPTFNPNYAFGIYGTFTFSMSSQGAPWGDGNFDGLVEFTLGYDRARYNTAVGFGTLLSNTTGYNNTAVGFDSGSGLTTGINNAFFGAYSGSLVTTGNQNIILGSFNGNQGGLDITTSDNYIVLSDGAGNPRAYWNSANAVIGGSSEFVASIGSPTQDGVIVTGRSGGTSSYRVTLRPTTLTANRTLTLPDNTGTVLTTGATVTVAQGGTGLTSFTANQVLYAPSSSSLGQSANLTFDGTRLTAANFSDSSLTSGRVTYAAAGGDLTDSANLTFDGSTLSVYGVNVGRGGGSVSNNIAIGSGALLSNVSGGSSFGDIIAVGRNALALNTFGYQNLAIGENALYSNDFGGENVAVGNKAQEYMKGNYNTSIGVLALRGSATPANNTGQFNVAVGYGALNSITSGSSNVAVGNQAGTAITSGGNNTIIGAYSGNQNGLDIRTANNYAVLSDGAGNRIISGGSGLSVALGNSAVPQSGTGITFPATQSSSSNVNTLDDYEEGTFTPSLQGSTGTGAVNYATRNGYYTKIGDLVYATVWIQLNSGSFTGTMQVGGLPFTVRNATNNYAPISIGYVDLYGYTQYYQLMGFANVNTTTVILTQAFSNTASSNAPVDSSFAIMFSVTYKTAT